jgi:hypothetical protein
MCSWSLVVVVVVDEEVYICSDHSLSFLADCCSCLRPSSLSWRKSKPLAVGRRRRPALWHSFSRYWVLSSGLVWNRARSSLWNYWGFCWPSESKAFPVPFGPTGRSFGVVK